MDGDAAGVGESVSIRRTRALPLNVELCVRFLWVIEEKSEKMRQWEGLQFFIPRNPSADKETERLLRTKH